MPELLFILALFGLLWLWRDSVSAREVAVTAARQACQRINAQFLDDTVMLAKVRLCRRQSGTMALCRYYSFDFSMDGEQRRSGAIRMKAQHIEDLLLDIDQVSAIQ